MSIITIDTSKPIYVSVFKNTNRTEENNQPVMNIIIQQDQQDLLKGGVWPKEAKSGLRYLNGKLEPAQEQAPKADPKQADADDDFPF